MQKRPEFVIFSSIAIAVTLLTLAGRTAISVGQGTAIVRLQSTTPGVAQAGNSNVTGTSRAGQFVGGGTGLTALNASQLTSGTVSGGRLPVPMVLSGSGTTVFEAYSSAGASGTVAVRGIVTDLTGIVYAVEGITGSPNGRGVFGWNQSDSGNAYGVYGRSDSSLGAGVFGTSVDSYGVRGLGSNTTGINYGVYGESASSSGRGVLGYNSSTTGTTYGLYGQVASSDGYGLYSIGLGTSILARTFGSSGTPIGLYAQANNATNTGMGVLGETSAPNGYGVMGINTALTGGLAIGVRGTGGQGVYGEGIAIGVHGTSYYGTGVYGYGQTIGVEGGGTRSVDGSVGVHGFTQNAIGYGVLGTFEDVGGSTGSPAYGIYGLVDRNGDRALIGDSDITTGSGYGVFGDTDGVGVALYASGNFAASGTKAFRIDHPFDPDNKFLLHYCTEGPEPLLEYSGTITTGSDGYAWVSLPDYFAAINRDLRYQLTIVDESGEFTQAIVSKRVKDNRFQIRTSRPNVDVCWEVKGIRNDRYVRYYGAPTEMTKPDNEKGLYEHPELFGLGRDRAFPHDQLKGYKKEKREIKVHTN